MEQIISLKTCSNTDEFRDLLNLMYNQNDYLTLLIYSEDNTAQNI